jgi:preprotein translocase SecE subunit
LLFAARLRSLDSRENEGIAMALAVKNMPETSSQRSLNRLAVASVAGTLYVLASLVLTFYGLPQLWFSFVSPWLAAAVGSSVDIAMMILVMIGLALGLTWLGVRLVGPQPAPGVKAGICMGIVGLLVVGVLTDWVGLALQSFFYTRSQLFGATSKSVGLGIMSGVGIVLLGFGIRLVFRPGFETWARRIEEQGWFDVSSYKRSQGQRVRRGTMLGVLVLAGCGIYTLLAHRTLETGSRHWAAAVPFTGSVDITDLGDAAVLHNPQLAAVEQAMTAPGKAEKPTVDPFVLQELNTRLLADYVRIADPGESAFKKGQVVSRSDFQKAVADAQGETPPTEELPVPAIGNTSYLAVTFLPDVRFTVPILLSAVALWFSWRLVNYPPFADFLIATEAELNKVSWTTRRRLIQDTTVVLVTVVLITVFLFAVDLVWSSIFSSRWIGILQPPSSTAKTESQTDW